MKNFKKIISFMLVAFFTMFTIAPKAFASEGNDCTSTVIEDNEFQRIVKASDSTGEYTATYNKLTGNIIVVDDNNEKIVDTIATVSVENGRLRPLLGSDIGGGGGGAELAHSRSDINHRYFYAKYTSGMWSLKVPNGSKTVMQNSSNSSALMGFRNAVIDMEAAQLAIMAAGTATMLATVTANLFKAPYEKGKAAVIAFFGGLGVLASAGVNAIPYYKATINANDYYDEAK
ncbi:MULTISPECIES: geobacillin-26 family protein [unclassified Clostridium]|uniref:geobacillin-26 family protein n=1 Tax=unclassified Clostridium TaxID=2614128 RepID=UPI0025BA62A5|nr:MULTISPECIES: geobacillin-26 family protein [unclassified Clostridium]